MAPAVDTAQSSLSELYATHAWRPDELLLQQGVLLQQRDDTAAHKAQLVFALRYCKHKLARLTAERHRSWCANGGQAAENAAVRSKRLQWWVRWWSQRSEAQQSQLLEQQQELDFLRGECHSGKDATIADLQAQLQAAQGQVADAEARAASAEEQLSEVKEKLDDVENESWMRQMEAVKEAEAKMCERQQVEMEAHVGTSYLPSRATARATPCPCPRPQI